MSVMQEVARMLELNPMRVYEVASFYTMVSGGERGCGKARGGVRRAEREESRRS